MKGELPDTWLAVSLERYIMAQGNSSDDAILEFKKMLAGEIIYGIEHADAIRPLAGIEPAPAKYWDAYERATPYRPSTPVSTTFLISKVPTEAGVPVAVPEVEELRLAA